MATNFTLAQRLAAGETVHTGWCGLPYPIVAETVAREGFVAVTIDQQHGLWDTAATLTGIAAIRQGGAAPIVRIPVNSFSTVSRALDFGAEGIIAAARKFGKIAGAYCHNAERAVALGKRGVRFLAVSSDMAFLRAGAAAQVKVLKGG